MTVREAQSVPASWQQVNSTKTAVRFHTPQTIKLQGRLEVLRDEVKRTARVAWIEFLQLCDVKLHTKMRHFVRSLGELDALLSLSVVSTLPGYTRPTYRNEKTKLTAAAAREEEQGGGGGGEEGKDEEGGRDGDNSEIKIIAGRHPMAERLMERNGNTFISNDVHLRCRHQNRCCQIVTGPNMGGKSSYVRMIALISLMGQIGAHVPADEAFLFPFDNILTRMGAGDDLAAGQSTFMAELSRTAGIIKLATSQSLVILDELGRGTSTFDGVAIAISTLRYIVRTIGCTTLFVTHYPQVTTLINEDGLRGKAINAHMSYIETSTTNQLSDEQAVGQSVMFLYKVVEKASKGSYGLNVARLADLDNNTLKLAAKKAREMLEFSSKLTQMAVNGNAPSVKRKSENEIIETGKTREKEEEKKSKRSKFET